MQIRNTKLPQPNGPYTIAGGAVQSLEKTAFFGYYEVNMKSSRIAMSSTFWMSNFKRDVIGPTKVDEDCQLDKWSQELDIIESIGGVFNGGSKFRTQMNFNTHYRYIDCEGSPEVFFSAGNNAVEGNGQEADAALEGSESWEDFHTYGCYWKDVKNFDFYVDSRFAGSVGARTDVVDDPFSRPMGINMVNETYNWARPLPSDEELANNLINTSFYNWVRSYRLIPIDDPEPITVSVPASLANGDAETGNLNGYTSFAGPTAGSSQGTTNEGVNVFEGTYALELKLSGGIEQQIANLEANSQYKLSAQIKVVTGRLTFGVKQNAGTGTVLEQVLVLPENQEYRNVEFNFETTNDVAQKIFLFTPAGQNTEAYIDNIKIETVSTPGSAPIVKPAIFEESIVFAENPTLNDTRSSIEVSYVYKANVNRDLTFRVVNEAGVEVASQTIDAREGFGKNDRVVPLDQTLPEGTYTIFADLVEDGGTTIVATTDSSNPLSSSSFVDNDFEFSLSPNPARSSVQIQASGLVGETTVTVIDMLGRTQSVSSLQEADSGNLDVSGLTPGVYFIVLENNTKTARTKLVVQ